MTADDDHSKTADDEHTETADHAQSKPVDGEVDRPRSGSPGGSIFINYVREPGSATPTTIATARALLGAYLCWKLLSLPLTRLDDYPALYDGYAVLRPATVVEFAWAVQFLAVVAALAFAVGYWRRLSAFLCGTLVSYVGVLLWGYNRSGNTQALFVAAVVVVLFGVYSRPSGSGAAAEDAVDDAVAATPLRALLAILGLLYFGSGLGKLLYGGLDWISPRTLGRYLLFVHRVYDFHSPLAGIVLDLPVLLGIAAVGTLVLELGLLPALLFDRGVDVFVAGLLVFHVAVALVLGPIFFDQLLFFGLVVDWDRLGNGFRWFRSGFAGPG